MNIHAGRESGIVNLHALDFVDNQQFSPTIMHLGTISEKLEITFNHAGKAIRLGHAQPEAVLANLSCRNVPKLA